VTSSAFISAKEEKSFDLISCTEYVMVMEGMEDEENQNKEFTVENFMTVSGLL